MTATSRQPCPNKSQVPKHQNANTRDQLRYAEAGLVIMNSEPAFAALLARSFSLNSLLASKFAFRFTCFCKPKTTLYEFSRPQPQIHRSNQLSQSLSPQSPQPFPLQSNSNSQDLKSTYKEYGTRSNLLAKALVQLNLQVVAGSKELLHRVILMTFLEIHDHLPQSNQHPLKNRNDT
jgi:hypothetical protein